MDKDSSKPAASSASTTLCSPPRTRSRGSDDCVGATKVTGRRTNGTENNNALAQSSTVDDVVASPSQQSKKKKPKHEHDVSNATISNVAPSTIAANTPTYRPPLQPLQTRATKSCLSLSNPSSPLRTVLSPLAATSAASTHRVAKTPVGGGSFKSEEHDVSNPAPTTCQTFSIIGVGDGRNSKQITNVIHLLRGLSAKVPLAPVAYNPIVAKENETFYPFDKGRKKKSNAAKSMMAQVTRLGKLHELTFNGKDSFERRWNRLRMEMKLKGILVSSLGNSNHRFSLVCAQPKDQRIATTHKQTIDSGCFLHCNVCDTLTRATHYCSGKFALTAEERAINNFNGGMYSAGFLDHSESCELYKKTCPCNKTFLGLLAEGLSMRAVTNHMKQCTGGVPDADALVVELRCFHDEFGMQTKPILSGGQIGRGRGWNVTREGRLCKHLTRVRKGEIPTNDKQKQQFMNLGEELKLKSRGLAVAGLQFRYGEIAIFAGSSSASEKAFKMLKRFKSGAHAKKFRAKKDTNEEWAGLTIHSATTNLNGWITTKEAIQAKKAWFGSNAYKTAKNSGSGRWPKKK